MANYSSELDEVFLALADPTRRAVIRRLGAGPASVGDLAGGFPITLPSFLKHVRMLEATGLIRTAKRGRVRTCVLDRERLALVDDWLAGERRLWTGRTDRLEAFVTAATSAPTEAAATQPVTAAPAAAPAAAEPVTAAAPAAAEPTIDRTTTEELS